MRVLIVEDDVQLAESLRTALAARGMVADIAVNVAQAAAATMIAVYRVCIVDWNLPDGTGIDVLKILKSRRVHTSILMLTARDSTAEKVVALDAGADDYLAKPYDIDELLARLRALARRPTEMALPPLQLANLKFDFEACQAFGAGAEIELPRKQLLVLEALALRAGRTVSRESLTNAIYSIDDMIESNTLESHISRLRKAIGNYGVEIHTLRGLGYVLRASSVKPEL